MAQTVAPDLAAFVTPTPRRIPEPYLRAEVTAFPVASEESFRLGLLELDPRLGDSDTDPTRKLWRACEGSLAEHSGWSLDRLVAARDRGWFGTHAGGGNVSMADYLRHLAHDHLVPTGGATRIRESTELSSLDAVIHYRWLTLVLPEDLLMGGLGVEPAPIAVDLDPPMLKRRLLDLGVAEIHQHIGAAMDFTLLWASALAAMATPAIGEDELYSPGAPLGDGKTLVRWLLAAAIARCLLAEHLIRGTGRLVDLLDTEILSPSADRVWTERRRETLVAVIAALVSAQDERLPRIEPLRNLYAELHPSALLLDAHPIRRLDEAYRRLDPIAHRLALHGHNAGERWLIRKGLAYLERSRASGSSERARLRSDLVHDELFARLFWQVVRLRCQYYRAVVERPMTGGLQWFLRFYGRLQDLRRPLNPILAEAAFRHAAAGQPIKAMELRTSPSDTTSANARFFLNILRSWRQVLCAPECPATDPEIGVVLHFVKWRDPENSWSKGAPPAFWSGTHDEPAGNRGGASQSRFIRYFSEEAAKARALAQLIEHVPSCLWLLRGLDVATDELGVPTWILVPLFRHVVDTSTQVSLYEGAGPPLQVTAHVGEDFRHLLEGLRRIYECVHYVLGGAGGRLGHAVALGIDPQSWAESVGSVLMPAEERLWDLVWEWRLYSHRHIRPEFAAMTPEGRMDVILQQVDELSERIFGATRCGIDTLAEAQHTLHRFLVPPHAPRPRVEGGLATFRQALGDLRPMEVRQIRHVRRLIERYLEDEEVFLRGQELIDIPTDRSEVSALEAVQHALRRGIGQRGIVIEVNPSSNLLIGDLLDLRRHPILRLYPPTPDPDGPPPVPIALGSDDPLTFSTRLLREYTLLYYSALAAGYPERSVNDWIEAIRRTGMDARFTVEWLPNAAKKTERLIDDLERYLNLPRSSDR